MTIYTGANVQQIVQWFDLGGESSCRIPSSGGSTGEFEGIQAWSHNSALGGSQKESPEQTSVGAEFILEGLHAHKRIGRSGCARLHRPRGKTGTRAGKVIERTSVHTAETTI